MRNLFNYFLILCVSGTLLANDWEPVTLPNPVDGFFYDYIAANQDVQVAMSSDGRVTRSTDRGENWFLTDTNLKFEFRDNPPPRDLVWTGTQFVTVGEKNFWGSEDGLNWRLINVQVPPMTTQTRWDGHLFHGQGTDANNNPIYYRSPDFIHWELAPQPNLIMEKVAQKADLYLGLLGGNLYQSNDGIAWTKQSLDFYVRDMVATSKAFVLAGERMVQVSNDGSSWQEIPIDEIGNFKLHTNGDAVLLVSWSRTYLASGQLQDWEIISEFLFRPVTALGTRFLCISGSGLFYLDENEFIRANKNRSYQIRDMVVGPKGLLLTAGSSTLLTTDLQAWDKRNTTNEILALAWTGTHYIEVSSRRNQVWEINRFSDHLPYWQGINSISTHDSPILGDLLVRNDRLLLVGNGFYSTRNQLYGTMLTHDDEHQFLAVANDDYLFVTLGGPQGLYIGEQFFPLQTVANVPPQIFDALDLTWDGQQFVVVGKGGLTGVSRDARRWTWSNVGKDVQLNTVEVVSKGLIAVGNNGTVAFSKDGLNWELSETNVEEDLISAIEYQDQILVGGENQTLLKLERPKDPPKYILPWLENNEHQRSEISIFNPEQETVTAHLEAVTTDGQRTETTITLAAQVLFTSPVEEIFPGLDDYTIYIHSNSDRLKTASVLLRTTSLSGRSPAQAVGLKTSQLSDKVQFGFLPTGAFPNMVVSRPDARPDDCEKILFTVYGPDGYHHERKYTLVGNQPLRILVGNNLRLFDDGIYSVIAKSEQGNLLVGQSLFTNHNGETAASPATTLPRRLPGLPYHP